MTRMPFQFSYRTPPCHSCPSQHHGPASMGRLALDACLLGCLLAALELGTAQPAQGATGEELEALLQPLMPELPLRTSVGTARELLDALNTTAGSSEGQLITLTADIAITTGDMRTFEGSLPINSGNRTLVLLGGKPGGGQTLLDWGGAVNLMYHPVGHSFIPVNLVLQGMPPVSTGISAGLKTQPIGSYLWPCMTGEPGHLVAPWYSTMKKVQAHCSPQRAAFVLSVLRHAAGGRSNTVLQLAPDTIFIGQQLNQTFAVRNLTTGDYVGNILSSWDHTTLQCVEQPPSTAKPAAGAAADLSTRQSAPTGVAGTTDELLFLLSSPTITRIVLGSHLSLEGASLDAFTLPIMLSQRRLRIESNDDKLRALEFGRLPRLLYVSSSSSLSLARVHLQGIAAPSSVMPTAATSVEGSPVWPTVDGAAGHQMELRDSVVHAVVTPCSRNATQITVDLLRKLVGAEGVQPVGSTGYIIIPRHQQQEPIIDVLSTQQVGLATYTFQNTIFECEEDAGVALTSEVGGPESSSNPALEALLLGLSPSAEPSLGATPTPSSTSAGGGGGKSTAAVPAAAAAAGAAALLAAAGAGLLVWRRRKVRRAAAAAAKEGTAGDTSGTAGAGGSGSVVDSSPKLAELAHLTPRGARLHRMESAELSLADKLDAAAAAAAAVGAVAQAASASLGSSAEEVGAGEGRPAGQSPDLLLTGSLESLDSEAEWQALWRTRFGVIQGLEIGEMLGRGAYGKVYKGRWNGAVVAVKVIEHRVSAGDPSSLSREPLLCMSVSHPNCISTFKLSVIRLLRGEDLLDHDETTSPRVSLDSAVSNESGPVAASSTGGRGRRVLRSLLSGAEAEEVADPYGALQPGLYETWIVSEFCDRGALSDALAEKRLRLPDGCANMVAVYLCLLDVAAGMQYLHSLGIMHSDLKPANVLLKGARNSMRGFSCKLADFGLSRMLDGRATHVETGSYGTPTHAAPELLREGRLSPAVDVFAFGVLAWELVAGEDAYRGWHPMHIIMQVTQHGVRPPPLERCPPELAALMERCWQEDPAARPSFSDVLLGLQQQLAALRQLDRPPRSGRPSADTACTMTTQPSSQLSRAGSAAPLLLPPVASGELEAPAKPATAE